MSVVSTAALWAIAIRQQQTMCKANLGKCPGGALSCPVVIGVDKLILSDTRDS